jgi:hypothetical protein
VKSRQTTSIIAEIRHRGWTLLARLPVRVSPRRIIGQQERLNPKTEAKSIDSGNLSHSKIWAPRPVQRRNSGVEGETVLPSNSRTIELVGKLGWQLKACFPNTGCTKSPDPPSCPYRYQQYQAYFYIEREYVLDTSQL